jgi:hypothetical protein
LTMAAVGQPGWRLTAPSLKPHEVANGKFMDVGDI